MWPRVTHHFKAFDFKPLVIAEVKQETRRE